MPEDLLRRYRPVGPPAALRGRILAPERAAWPWAVAAAALVALIVGVHMRTRTMVANQLGRAAGPVSVEIRVAALTEALGGNEEARRTAVLLVAKEELERRLPRPFAFAGEER